MIRSLTLWLLACAPLLLLAQTSAPVTAPLTQPADDPRAVVLLDRLEKKSAEIKALAATLTLDYVQGLLGDTQRRLGTLVYVGGPPARFCAHFNELRADGRSEKKDRWYIFDGIWLVEKYADQEPKRFIKRQLTPPQVRPEDANPLALGRGPFALPLNMNRAQVLERFTAELRATDDEKDPKNSVHLVLKPRPNVRCDADQIDLWYDRDTLLPVRVRTYSEASEKEWVLTLANFKVNAEVDTKEIDTTEPKDHGWDVVITPWEK